MHNHISIHGKLPSKHVSCCCYVGFTYAPFTQQVWWDMIFVSQPLWVHLTSVAIKHINHGLAASVRWHIISTKLRNKLFWEHVWDTHERTDITLELAVAHNVLCIT